MDTLKMKKQFQRMKQIADQTFMRAEKSEVLTEDVQLAEKRVDTLQKACSMTAKKIGSCITGQGNDGNSIEKRLKKIPAVVLGNAMLECSAPLGDDSIMSNLLTECGHLETKLGTELLQYEIELEQQVLQPLNQVEAEAANIAKLKRNLTKLIADMDSAKTRYQAALKHSASGGGNVGAKVDVVKEEMEDSQHKVDLAKDSYAADVYSLLAKEADLAQLILQLARCQSKYHRSALDLLEKQIPLLESLWSSSSQKPVFGLSLEEHLRLTERTVAFPIEVCVCALYESGLAEEGLFRIAGGASKVRKLKAALDAGVADLGFVLGHFRDVHVVAGTLKSYLRELPEAMLTYALYDEWCAAVKITDQEAKLQALWTVLQKLPETRRNNLRYLVKFLKEVSSHSDDNKMSVQNLSIVMAPGLIWSQADDEETLGRNMTLASAHAAIVENLITFADWFFPGEIDYYVTCTRYSLFAGSNQSCNNDDRDDGGFKEYTHRRMGSNEGVATVLRSMGSSGNILDPSAGEKESPRPVTRKKNKPAPVPPGLPSSSQIPPSNKSPPTVKTPEKEEQTLLNNDRPKLAEKPTLPPTGPDPKRPGVVDKRPAVAPRPSINPERPSVANPIGFEAIEKEVQERSKTASTQHRPSSDSHENSTDARKPPHPAHRRITSLDNTGLSQHSNPTAHPNAVPMFGLVQPAPMERTKFATGDPEKPRPQIPERPSLIAKSLAGDSSQAESSDSVVLRGSEVKTQEGLLPDEHETGIVFKNGEAQGKSQLLLERVHSFNVDKQQVSIVQLNQSAPLTLNSVDHPDIQFADVDDTSPTMETAPKPARPRKPERMSVNPTEANNNVKAELEEGPAAVPRPLPRPQPPPPPAKPRTGSNTSLGSASDSTDF